MKMEQIIINEQIRLIDTRLGPIISYALNNQQIAPMNIKNNGFDMKYPLSGNLGKYLKESKKNDNPNNSSVKNQIIACIIILLTLCD